MSDKTSEITGYATLLQELKGTDSETGLLTRTSLGNKLMQELARSDRYGNKLSVVSLRIVRDGSGQSGNGSTDLANSLGQHLGTNVRNVDYAARWSEWEFLVVLPETDEAGARVFADKIAPGVNALLQPESLDHEIRIEVAAYARGDDMAGLLSKVGL